MSKKAEINFYHLTKTPFEKALPQLLEKVLSSKKRAVVLAKDEDRLRIIDNFLWTFSTKRVVPHGTQWENFKDQQPVYLTTQEENPNAAEILVLVDGAEPAFIKDFSRTLDIFDGTSASATEAARARWKKYQADSAVTLTYWKQGESGNWEKAAA